MARFEGNLLSPDAPKENELCVASRFLFTEKDFKEYFIPAQIWLDEGYFKLKPVWIVLTLPTSVILTWFLIEEGDTCDIGSKVFFSVMIALPFMCMFSMWTDYREHYHPNFARARGDIEIFFARVSAGRPCALYGYTGSVLKELRGLKHVARAMGITKENPLGGRQSESLGVVLETRIYDDRVVSGGNGEVVIADWTKDVGWIIDSKRFLIIRNNRLVDAVIDKNHIGGLDPKLLKKFIKMKKKGYNIKVADLLATLPREDQ